MRSDATSSRRSSPASYISRTLPEASRRWPSRVACDMGLRLTSGGVGTAADFRKDRASNRRRILASHEPLDRLQLVEAELAVEAVRVGRREHEAAQALELGVLEDRGHESLAEAAAAVTRLDVQVGDPRERRPI